MPPGILIKHRLAFATGLLMAVMGVIYLLWPAPPIVTGPPLPSPNGYDDFVKAGAMLGPPSYDYSKMPMEELKACLSTNQEPLRLVRLGLTRECQVPTEDSMDYIRRHFPDLSTIKRVAHFISAECRLAEMEGRFADSAKSHLNNVRYGQVSANGGLMIDKLVGTAVENMGLFGLERLVDKLDARQAREAIATLEEVDARSTPASVFIVRDRQWSRKAEQLTDKLRVMWEYKTLFVTKLFDQQFTYKLQTTDRRRRKLLLNLASRVYELETGNRPQQATDLVPGILRALPKDPGTSTNLTLPASR